MAKLNIRIHEGNAGINAFHPRTVKIGDQTWMAENLAIDDGGEGITYNPDNNQFYYSWNAAKRVAKSLPGWHLPTAEEWNTAAEACGAKVTYNRWSMVDPRMCAYNGAESLYARLSIQPEGAYYSRLHDVGVAAYFWTATDFNSFGAFSMSFESNDIAQHDTDNKKSRFSVRLVRD